MSTSVVLAFLAIAVVSVLGQYGHQQEGGHHNHLEEYVDYRAPPHYDYAYSVHDPHHHDIKSHKESRDKDITKGMYTLLQPDGRTRIVEYVAGKHGVEYNVRYEGHASHHSQGHY